jgi:hypothetical protein
LSLIAIYQVYDHIKYGTDDEQKELMNAVKLENKNG